MCYQMDGRLGRLFIKAFHEYRWVHLTSMKMRRSKAQALEKIMYRAITEGIEVSVEPFFLQEHSDPEENRYVWAYQVTITNHTSEAVQLISRYWHITDEMGRIEEVRGDGVVGEQPELGSGDSYQYTSACPLKTPSGIMVGRYMMRTDAGELFEIDIPAFSLDMPGLRSVLN